MEPPAKRPRYPPLYTYGPSPFRQEMLSVVGPRIFTMKMGEWQLLPDPSHGFAPFSYTQDAGASEKAHAGAVFVLSILEDAEAEGIYPHEIYASMIPTGDLLRTAPLSRLIIRDGGDRPYIRPWEWAFADDFRVDNLRKVVAFPPKAVVVRRIVQILQASLDRALESASRDLLDTEGSKIAPLVKAGASPNTCSVDGHCPLSVAVSVGHLSAVEELLQSGAHPDGPTVNGSSPLRVAVYCCKKNPEVPVYEDIIRALVEAGANVDVPWELGTSLADEIRALELE